MFPGLFGPARTGFRGFGLHAGIIKGQSFWKGRKVDQRRYYSDSAIKSKEPSPVTKALVPVDKGVRSIEKKRHHWSLDESSKTSIDMLNQMNYLAPVESHVAKQQVFNPLRGKLDRPAQIKRALVQHQFVVVAGPGYTGKTEQIDLAVPGRTSIDIKSEYLKDKFHGEIPDEAWDHYDQHKAGEKEWLEQNIDRLIDEFGAHESDVVAIDEADYYGINSELLLKLIDGLKDQGKGVILILHPEGLKNQELFSALEEAGVYQDPQGQMVKTGWYTREEELNMLTVAGYELEEARKIMDCVKGNPVAYVGILKEAQKGVLRSELRLPVEQFLQKAQTNNEKMIEISMQSADFPTAIRLMASPIVAVYSPSISSRFNQIIQTSLNNQQYWNRIIAHVLMQGEGLPVTSSLLINHWMGNIAHLDQMHQCLESATALGIDTRLMRCSQGHVYLVGSRHQVNPLQTGVLRRIGQEVSEASLLTEASLPVEAREWWALHSNSAVAIDQLQRDAQQCWPMLKSLTQEVAGQFSGVFIDAGPGDMYAVKGAKRMQEKVEGYMETGLTQEEAVGQLTDPLRVSIVIGEKSNATYADVAKSLNQALADNPNIHFHVCMNKFENSNPNSNPMAYGAVHIVAVLSNPDGSRVFSEIQIHKEQPLKVKNGAMHQLYEMTRTAGAPPDTRQKGTLAQQLLSSVAHFSTMSLSYQYLIKDEIAENRM